MAKKVSVVIPVKNEAKKIKDCIESLINQTIKAEEIIVLDSGSTDGTLDILANYPAVKVIHIPPVEFNHGETRNAGIKEAKGDYILLTVGDAVAHDNKLIQNLLSGFDDEKVACVYGQQIVPHDKDKNPMEWFMPVTKNPKAEKRNIQTKEAFEQLKPQEKMHLCTIDDVIAMYKKTIISQMPFEKVTYGEDIIWGKKAIENGYTIAYNPNARVYHYHITDAEFNFKRTISVLYLKYKLFKYIPKYKQDILYPLRVVKKMFKIPDINFSKKMYWFKYNIRQRRAVNKAIKVFIKASGKGEQELDKVYKTISGKPPIPIK